MSASRPHFIWASARVLLPFCLTGAAFAQSELKPWFYNGNGTPLTQRHENFEDNSDTVYSLAWEFMQLSESDDQPSLFPDALLFNGPHFDPPEGVAAAAGTRKLLKGSIEGRALQLYVNYNKALVDYSSTSGSRYPQPTFFIATLFNSQPNPPLQDVGLIGTYIAPTRGALGVVDATVTAKSRFPFWHEPAAASFATQMNALYVTAGIGVPLAEFDSASQTELALATKDRLLKLQSGMWTDVTSKIQPSSTLTPAYAYDGNSSGACFADFNNDGYLDLFIGKPGDGYAGGQSRLLLYRTIGGGIFADATVTHLPTLSVATVDVAAGDLDLDGDQDIVMANRMVRGGPAGAESIDYYLINDGTGHFTATALSNVQSDSRSVAVGDLDYVGGPEIVLGNSGSDGFSNTLAIPSGSDHPLQIYRNTATYPALTWLDDVSSFLSGMTESEISRPFTWQVVIADAFNAGVETEEIVDEKPDLILVNHRDILLDAPATGVVARDASNVRILVNPDSGSTRTFIDGGRHDHRWAKTVAVADFTFNNNEGFGDCSEGSLDLLIGTGNSYSGYDTQYMENVAPPGGTGPTFNNNGNLGTLLSYDAMPGNERGYGFDFADFKVDGFLEMLQTSRGYNFLAFALSVTTSGAQSFHWDPTVGSSAVQMSNARGRLFPIGAEDAVFADFDRDEDALPDAILATQKHPSGSHPDNGTLETFDTAVLRNAGAGVLGFLHSTTTVGDTETTGSITTDTYINVGNRRRASRPDTADRAVAVDLDNDGDEDALVRLFPIFDTAGSILIPQMGTAGLTSPIAEYSVGFRYLKNIATGSSGPWFDDIAPTHLHDASTSQVFSNDWNRPLGFEILADFDNNGACDWYSLVIDAAVIGTDITVKEQGYDALFMNGVSGQAVGHLVESSATHGIVQRYVATPTPKMLGSGGGAQGDFDNDGDTDLFISCAARLHFSKLLINQLGTSAGFVDEFALRVPTDVSVADPIIHSELGVGTTRVHDEAGVPIIVDFDGDGDLDLIFPVASNVPRVYRNKGTDSNSDGFIDVTDGSSRPGTFEDVTSTFIKRVRPIVDSVDSQAVDVDRDGDYDLAFDCFDDEVVFVRNEVANSGNNPTITEAWPRVGSVRGRTVRLEGVNLANARAVQLVCRATSTTVNVTTGITTDSLGRISFTMPNNTGLKGLVQIRVRKAGTPPPADEWTKQYFGYFVFGQ